MTDLTGSRVTVYSTDWCGFCEAAKRLLDERGIDYEQIDISGDAAFRQRVFDLSGQWTVPLVVVDGRTVGGFRELLQLDWSGGLDQLMAA
jgi:glutaredoxin 3